MLRRIDMVWAGEAERGKVSESRVARAGKDEPTSVGEEYDVIERRPDRRARLVKCGHSGNIARSRGIP